MPLTRAERFRLKSRIVEALSTDEWNFDRTNLLLSEFGLETLDREWNGLSVADIVASAPEPIVMELYALVMGVDLTEVERDLDQAADTGNWKSGYLRLFVSHSAAHREFVAEVAAELAVVGIHAFVAHDTMEYSKPWQLQIERALRSMQAFVAIVHEEFNSSPWCQQEAGWAQGRGVPRYAIRMGVNPAGFLASDQWPSGVGGKANQVAQLIVRWISSLSALGPALVEGLFSALASAGNYIDAGAAADRLAALSSLSVDDFRKLDQIWWSNDQLWGGVLPTQAMKPFYLRNGRDWPPPKPQTVSRGDEEPF